MADQDKDSKTEEPTEKRIRDAVDKGKTAVSREVPIAASLFVILVWLGLASGGNAMRFSTDLAYLMDHADSIRLTDGDSAVLLARHVGSVIGGLVLPLLGLLALAGVCSAALQSAPRMVLERIRPKWSNISPKSGWNKIASKKGLVEFAKSLAKVAFAGLVVALLMRERLMSVLSFLRTPPANFVASLHSHVLFLIGTVVLFMVVIALVDFVVTKRMWWRDQMMTKQEVKDEMKQAEGDPQLKAKMRSVGRARVRNRMMSKVPEATLVVVNPTHYAIAMRYVPERDAAPLVIAKGTDEIALRIRSIAESHEIPVFENVDLAQALYRSSALDTVIPVEFYRAIAELIRIVNANAKRDS